MTQKRRMQEGGAEHSRRRALLKNAGHVLTAVRNTDSVYSFATLRLNVTPAQPVEGLKLTFTFRPSEGKPTSAEAVDLGGGSYRADVTLMDAVTPISVTLTLDDGVRQYVRGLVRITSITPDGSVAQPLLGG